MFDTLKKFARAVFSDQIRLRRRKGRGLELALAPAGSRDFTPSEIDRDERARAEQALYVCMLEELTQVLSGSPSLRGTSPHLMQLHTALRDQGLVLLKALPLPVLTRALAEFEDAVSNWSPVGLATLRSKIAVAVAERQRVAASAGAAAPAAHEPRDSMPEVTELSAGEAAEADPAAALMAAYSATAVAATTASATPTAASSGSRRVAAEAQA